jgi:hypothetical protein
MDRTANFSVGASPVPEIQQAARTYQMRSGLHVPQREGYDNVTISPNQQSKIADAYDALPDFDSKAVPAYRAMAEETGRQFDFMTKPKTQGGLGIDVSVHKEDPYAAAGDYHNIIRRVRHDVTDNDHIGVLSTASTGGHPFFTDDQNDMFRAVHDVFGHLGSGRGVDRHGEEAAYLKHSRMFTPLARQAMATETRGQNAALHKHGDFQDQRVGLLPEHMQSAQFGQGNWADRLASAQDARIANERQGI